MSFPMGQFTSVETWCVWACCGFSLLAAGAPSFGRLDLWGLKFLPWAKPHSFLFWRAVATLASWAQYLPKMPTSRESTWAAVVGPAAWKNSHGCKEVRSGSPIATSRRPRGPQNLFFEHPFSKKQNDNFWNPCCAQKATLQDKDHKLPDWDSVVTKLVILTSELKVKIHKFPTRVNVAIH